MELQKLTAVFGKLQGQELILQPGLNLIEAPNEAGKSTWAGFIRAMLYGVSTAERSKAGSLPDKRRYLPWSGQPMQGAMALRWRGDDVTLTRTAPGAGKPMGAVSAVYTGTGEKVPALMTGVVGETLTGVTEPVFRRSAFISGADMAVDANSELEKRITALVTSGEEDSSYTEGDERLRRWQRKRRWRSSAGRLNEAEKELDQVRAALGQIETENDRLAALREEQEQLTALREALELELKRHRRDQRLEQLAQLKKAEAAAGAAADRLAALAEKTRGLTAEKIAALREAGEAQAQAQAETAARQAACDAARAEKAALPDPAEKRPGRQRPLLITLFLLGVLCLLGGVAAGMRALPVAAAYGLYGAGLAALLAASLVLAAKRRADKAQKEERTQALARAGETLSALEAQLAQAADRQAALESRLGQALAQLGAAASENPAVAAERAEGLMRAQTAAREEADRSREMFQALSQAAGTLAEEPVPGETRMEQPQAEDYLQRTTLRLQEVSRDLARGEGSYARLGDPLVLATAQRRLGEEIQQLEREYAALDLAIDALREANTRLQTLFSPLVSRTAASLLARMTDGAYQGVYFDKNLRFTAQREGEAAVHELEYLSDGTRNQLYLAVRLAICQLALPAEDPCPLVLDDVLTTFDDRRAKQTLRLFRELAAERQIILFTCQSRDKRLLAELMEEEA